MMNPIKPSYQTFSDKKISLPNDWNTNKLGNLANVFSGGTPSRDHPEYYFGDIPWIKSGELNQRYVSWTEEKITKDGLAKSSAKLIKPETLLMALYGATSGIVAIAKISAAINQAVLAIKPNVQILNNEFLFQFLEYARPQILAIYQQGGQPNLSGEIVKSLQIPVPSINEQAEIAKILSTWDRAIERVQRLIEAKQRQKKGLMQGLLTGRIRFSEFGEPINELGNIPDGWKSVEFHECATRSNKKIDPATNDFNFRCVELEHISQESGKIIGETESKQQTSSKNYFRPGNVLFGKLRPYLHKFAFCDFEGVCSSEIWVLQSKSICTSRYLFYLVQTDTFLSASIQTTGTKMPRSDWNVVRKAKFALPTLNEQERITALLDQVEQNIELLERYIMRLNQQKKGLMQKLLTGEIRVKVD